MAEDKHPSSNSGETEEKNTGRDNQSVDHDESARADGKRHSHPVRDTSLHPELEWKEQMKGKQPGNRYVRVMRPYAREFKRRAPGHLVATERVLQPKGPSGRLGEFLRRLIIGRRIPSELEAQERTGKVKGLALFASDNISSSAYASEEIMRVLVLAGAAALLLTMPITIAIVIVLAVVVVSYSQVIRAYPGGGGSYVVAHENMGQMAGLAAAAALTTDYILTVAVSTSAGVAAITSAFPELFAQRVAISVAVVALMTVMNLRGIRESGTVFAAPTYAYLIAVLGLMGIGVFRYATGTLPTYIPPPGVIEAHGVEPLAVFLVLRAFASGSVALTGVEAVSNGVPAFKPPEVKNAQTVLVAMGTLFGAIFLGISFLAGQMQIIPSANETETVISQVARLLVGTSWYYYAVQFATAVILVLAANTAFNGFPLLAGILARDKYLPTQFQFRGDRLAYTLGITILAVISSFLIVAYQGSVTGLIPLYTVGVFLAFTLSQAGMVRRWHALRATERGWRWRAAVNAVGMLATGIVMVVVAVTKFLLGAWIVVLLIPLLMALMWAINRHYRNFEDALTLNRTECRLPEVERPKVVVPISRLDRAAQTVLAYAQSISNDVTAVHVTDDPDDAESLRRRWEDWGCSIPLVIVESPYRALIQPLLAYIDAVDKQDPHRPITVVLSQFVPNHFWEWVLHNQTTLRLKIHLFFRRNTIVVDVPYRMDSAAFQDSIEERRT